MKRQYKQWPYVVKWTGSDSHRRTHYRSFQTHEDAVTFCVVDLKFVHSKTIYIKVP